MSLDLVLEHLRAIRATQDRHTEALETLTQCVSSPKHQMAGIHGDPAGVHGELAGINRRFDGVDRRLDRIERRLELTDGLPA